MSASAQPFQDGSQRARRRLEGNRTEKGAFDAHRPLNPATILVLANETADADALLDVIERSAGDEANVLVVAPALNSRLRHWASDEDDAREQAKQRLQRSVELLHAAGVDATGMIGDADPLQALRDALAWFPRRPADRRHAPRRPLELARDEPRRAREPPLRRADPARDRRRATRPAMALAA